MTFQGPEKIGWNEPAPTPENPSATSYVHGQTPQTAGFRLTSHRGNPLRAPWSLVGAGGLYLAAVGYLTYLMIHGINSTTVRHDFFWELVTLKSVALLAIVVLVVVMLTGQPWGRYALSAVSVVGILLIVTNGFWPASLLGIAAVILMWLPRGNAWFGFR